MSNKDLTELRQEIDVIDKELVTLFQQRMKASAQVAQYKQEHNMPILQPAREREKLMAVSQQAQEDMQAYTRVLYSLLFELSRTYQGKLTSKGSKLFGDITHAIESTPRLFPQQALVACQGIEGAYSQIACERIFKTPSIQYFKNFDGVFAAIDEGFCQYGILPIENSTAGSVNKIYDLMIDHDFSIVRSFSLKIDHCLLAKKGAKLGDIKEIFSHEQAIGQCSDFIKSLGDVKVTCCENTAVGAQIVASSERADIAALSSQSCGELYGLSCLKACAQDGGNNRTKFICISKNLEIYPGADKTSIMLILPHKAGALYKILARFYALGINLINLKSRPIPNRDFEFMFYLDLDTSVYSQEFAELMCDIDSMCREFKYLGSYTEIV